MRIPKHLLLIFMAIATMGITACGTENAVEDDTLVEEDVCEQAARYRETCQGVYTTPPLCDEAAAASAAQMLTVACEDFDDAYPDQGKADGAFCDWFGAGCTPDEAIFTGPSCKVSAECAAGSFCVEERCFAGVTSDEFAETLDIFTQTTEDWGSFTYLLVDNDETRQMRRDLVENAEHSIHFVALFVENGVIGEEMVELFSAAAQRGVEVRVMVDATSQYMTSGYGLLKQMAANGVQVIPFNPITEWASLRLGVRGLTANNRLHEKMLIVDGAEAIIGGRNVGDYYLLADQWRDIDVYVDGPTVGSIQRLFLSIWDSHSSFELRASCKNEANYGFHCPADTTKLAEDPAYFPELEATSTARTRAIYSAPYMQDTSLGYLTTISLIRGAQHSITIANAYFVPPRRLRKHLRAAAARGVEVRVLTNSKESTDAWWMYYASINYYKELIGAGIKIYGYNGDQTMHSKVMLIDEELAVVGSYNLDPRSAIDNSEFLLLIQDSQSVGQLRDSLEFDISTNSTLETSDIPLSEIIKARSMRLVEPLL